MRLAAPRRRRCGAARPGSIADRSGRSLLRPGGGEHLAGDRHRRHGPRPACIERQMGDHLDDLIGSDAVVQCPAQVSLELFGAAVGDQRGEFGRNVTDQALGRGLWWFGHEAISLCAAAYSSSGTFSPQVVSAMSGSPVPSQIARWVMNRSAVAPCQCHSPGGVCTVSPGRITMTVPPRPTTNPMPSVTCRVWPMAWTCQAVCEPGAKCTAFTRALDGSAPR